MTSRDPQTHDPGAVPEGARETITRIAREHPGNRACRLARDSLHLAAIEAWQAIASDRAAPDIDPADLFQDMHDAFAAGTGISPVEQLIEDWYELALQSGINVSDEHGDLRPGIDQAITRTVTAAIWFGVTAGYFTLTGSYYIPRKYLAGV
jgi:hypothetical protein